MVYLFNTNLENKKKVKIALKSVFGIGDRLSKKICDHLGVTDSVRIDQLTTKQLEKMATIVNQDKKISAELKQEIGNNKKRLIQIASYRGFRHREGLPLHGQRTHSNAKTSRSLKTSFLIKKV
jgi:small subunit ribosomal protein S13